MMGADSYLSLWGLDATILTTGLGLGTRSVPGLKGQSFCHTYSNKGRIKVSTQNPETHTPLGVGRPSSFQASSPFVITVGKVESCFSKEVLCP